MFPCWLLLTHRKRQIANRASIPAHFIINISRAYFQITILETLALSQPFPQPGAENTPYHQRSVNCDGKE